MHKVRYNLIHRGEHFVHVRQPLKTVCPITMCRHAEWNRWHQSTSHPDKRYRVRSVVILYHHKDGTVEQIGVERRLRVVHYNPRRTENLQSKPGGDDFYRSKGRMIRHNNNLHTRDLLDEYYAEQELTDSEPQTATNEPVGSYTCMDQQDEQPATALGEALVAAGISAEMFAHHHSWVLEPQSGRSTARVLGRCECGAEQWFKTFEGLRRR